MLAGSWSSLARQTTWAGELKFQWVSKMKGKFNEDEGFTYMCMPTGIPIYAFIYTHECAHTYTTPTHRDTHAKLIYSKRLFS